MKKLVIGILAHVDAGKTTLSEELLYLCGEIRKIGRVDHGDAFLDTYELEKERGITIFSKQALLKTENMEVTLLDTPGHVDFSAEMERTLQVLDYAILVINGMDGVQSHTMTLWRLLERYQIPTFLFVNKMDQQGTDHDALLNDLKQHLHENCVDFGRTQDTDYGMYELTPEQLENIAVCEEDILETYLETGIVEDRDIARLIIQRKIFPCYFGSALKEKGVKDFWNGVQKYTAEPKRPTEFGAKVFKIARDEQGNRLTYMKITGGSLKVKTLLSSNSNGQSLPGRKAEEAAWEEKADQIRLYSGAKYELTSEAEAGTVCAVTGLTRTYPGEGLGIEQESELPILEPVLNYQIILPDDCDPHQMLQKLRQLEEEEPELHIVWEEEKKEIHAQIMGEIQMEILKSLIAERFGVEVRFGGRSIVYKETITDTVEGVGHFEPLRHYAEVHLLLEPGEPGSGLVFDTDCSEDILSKNWQRLVLTHLEEKVHRGVLIGAPITDMKITLKSGRAHVKHTEGGDFRQSVYRAVRQGLMQAHSVLLEPFYAFHLTIPDKMVGRAMTDLERRFAVFEGPALEDGQAILTGRAPVSALDGYQTEVTAYTGGLGQMICTLDGYGPCHNEEEIIAAAGYDADADLANPSGSVFCTHGAGFVVNWDEVKDYMHLESCLGDSNGKRRMDAIPELGARSSDGQGGGASEEMWIGTDEVDAILARTYHANKKEDGGKRRWGGKSKRPAETYGAGVYGEMARRQEAVRQKSDSKVGTAETLASGSEGKSGSSVAGNAGKLEHAGKAPESGGAGSRTGGSKGKMASAVREYLLVDGYNIIFSWDELNELAKINIDSARGKLLDILCDYQGSRGIEVIAVFDAYRVQGHRTEVTDYHNIHVVFTKEAETADQYIEKFAHENGRKYTVMVATSDRLEQIIIRGQGCGLYSARDFEEEVDRVKNQTREHTNRPHSGHKNYLLDSVPEEVLRQVKKDE